MNNRREAPHAVLGCLCSQDGALRLEARGVDALLAEDIQHLLGVREAAELLAIGDAEGE